MGTDIHTWAVNKDGEIINDNGRWVSAYGEYRGEPFGDRNYAVFGWLANVRNYSEITPMFEDRGWDGAPRELSNDFYGEEGHSHSWVSIDELNSIDYSAEIVDKRYGSKKMTLRQFLNRGFFMDLEELNRIGAERVWFCFYS